MGSIVVQAIAIVLCGLLRDFYLVVGLYLVYGVALGVAMPVKAGYLNAHIPSEQRATILSLRSEERRVGKECRYRWSAHDVCEHEQVLAITFFENTLIYIAMID